MKHERRYRSTGGRGGINRLQAAPYLQVLLGILILGVVIGFLYAVVYPAAKNLARGISPFTTPAPSGVTPAPTPSPSPSPDPAQGHSIFTADLTAVQKEIVVPEFQYLTDVTVYNGLICFPAGNYTIDGTAAFVRFCTYDPKTDTHTFLPLPLRYKSIRFPQINDRWIVYLDAAASGGGRLMAYDRALDTTKELKTVHAGLPQPKLWNDTLVWMERTGQRRDKLFACDLNSGESVALELFDSSEYALSQPTLCDGILYYVDPTGKLIRWTLSENRKETIETGTYVHDPKYNGTFLAYLSGNHGEDSDLYLLTDDGPVCLATGVADFALGSSFLAYNRYDRNFVYFPSDNTTFCTTRSDEKAMLLTAGDNLLVWMDVTWRDKDISEYMVIE